MYPGKKICTQEGDLQAGVGKTTDYLPGNNVYEANGCIIGKFI